MYGEVEGRWKRISRWMIERLAVTSLVSCGKRKRKRAIFFSGRFKLSDSFASFFKLIFTLFSCYGLTNSFSVFAIEHSILFRNKIRTPTHTLDRQHWIKEKKKSPEIFANSHWLSSTRTLCQFAHSQSKQ